MSADSFSVLETGPDIAWWAKAICEEVGVLAVARSIEVWGRENSSNVRKVLWLCEELQIEFVQHVVGGRHGGLDSPEYLAMNPKHKIPTIKHGSFVLWESNAILRYLGTVFGTATVWPEDVQVRARADQWMDWQVTTLRPPMVPLVLDWIYGRAMNQDACIAVEPKWRVLDEALGRTRYLAGDAFTLGDIPCAVVADWWFSFPIDRPSLPNLERWFSDISQRPGFRKFVLGKSYGPPEDH